MRSMTALLLVAGFFGPVIEAEAQVPGPWRLADGMVVFVIDIRNQNWQPTGVIVDDASASRLLVRVSGEANTAGYGGLQSYPWAMFSGPGGLNGPMAAGQHLLHGVPKWSVIGKIGEQPFYVGEGGLIGGPGSATGELSFAYNDDRCCFGDNFGYYVAYISAAEPAGILGDSPGNFPLLSALASPNPARGPVRIDCQVPATGSLTIAIYDVAGRLVRTLNGWAGGPGKYSNSWDGRDAVGRRVSSGTYFYRLTQNDSEVNGQVVLLP